MPKIARPVRPLADVNVLEPRRDGSREIVVCFMPDPVTLVGEANARAFLALDASASMRPMYGFAGPFGGDPNYVEKVARKLAGLLAEITRSGKVGLTYWAVSPDGSKTEELGELDESQWSQLPLTGPRKERWGRDTRMLPAIRYGVERIAIQADFTLGVIITDGRIKDEQECVRYCLELGRQIVAGKQKKIKLILIGIGEEVDEKQLQRFDDMFEGSGIDYDLWSHGLVASMQEEADILGVLYGELISEKQTVAPYGQVEDSSGRVLERWRDGLPGKFRFFLPAGQTRFVVRTARNVINQDISEVLR